VGLAYVSESYNTSASETDDSKWLDIVPNWLERYDWCRELVSLA